MGHRWRNLSRGCYESEGSPRVDLVCESLAERKDLEGGSGVDAPFHPHFQRLETAHQTSEHNCHLHVWLDGVVWGYVVVSVVCPQKKVRTIWRCGSRPGLVELTGTLRCLIHSCCSSWKISADCEKVQALLCLQGKNKLSSTWGLNSPVGVQDIRGEHCSSASSFCTVDRAHFKVILILCYIIIGWGWREGPGIPVHHWGRVEGVG